MILRKVLTVTQDIVGEMGEIRFRLQKQMVSGPAGSRRGIAKIPWEEAGGQGLRVVG